MLTEVSLGNRTSPAARAHGDLGGTDRAASPGEARDALGGESVTQLGLPGTGRGRWGNEVASGGRAR